MRPNGHPFAAGGWVLDGVFERDNDTILFGAITGSWKDLESQQIWHQEGVGGLFYYLMESSTTTPM